MHILFLTTAHNSLSQRAWVELSGRGHRVDVHVTHGSADMVTAVARSRPELIVAPMLKSAIPETVWRRHVCLIVHPGIRGDRGPSSLDWAIRENAAHWGVTVLQADAEMDAGPIWSWREFPMRAASKSSLYRHEVTEAAVAALLEAVERFQSRRHVPEPLDYACPGVRGRLRPAMRQSDRAIDWTMPMDEIVRRVRSADSVPGVRDTLCGEPFYLYGAHPEDGLRGRPGSLLARRDGAVCRACGDGAVWITHLKRPGGIKLPATMALGETLTGVPERPSSWEAAEAGRTWREIRYAEHGAVGVLAFEFYNGAMSTAQCRRLLSAYRWARQRPTRILLLLGGEDFWSNGIHLNVIEAAADPAAESWRNILAMNALVREIILTDDRLTIAALQGNAGAGGVMLALAADQVWARQEVVLNPHYQGMGGLYGSEYWTYLLPRRVGGALTEELTESLLPLGTARALRIGLIDGALPGPVAVFRAQALAAAQALAESAEYSVLLADKRARRAADERRKPLEQYAAEELVRMRYNFFGPDRRYHEARRRFVHKQPAAGQSAAEPVRVRRPQQDVAVLDGWSLDEAVVVPG